MVVGVIEHVPMEVGTFCVCSFCVQAYHYVSSVCVTRTVCDCVCAEYIGSALNCFTADGEGCPPRG